MAQALQDILKELDAGYSPSRDLINQQMAQLPGQSDAQIAGLKGQQTDAFNQITNGARDRGMGFSGIPLADQATYTSSTFLPAVAKVYETQNSNKNTLLDALNNLGMDQQKTALGIQQNQQQMDFQREQAAAARRASGAAQASLGSLLGAPSSGPSGPAALPSGMGYKAGSDGAKGFSFNWGSKPVSAATYAKVNNLNIGDLLYSMAQSGDAGAAAAYRDVVNNKGNINQNIMNKYSGLFWGEIPAAKAPVKAAAAKAPVKTFVPPINVLKINNPLALKR